MLCLYMKYVYLNISYMHINIDVNTVNNLKLYSMCLDFIYTYTQNIHISWKILYFGCD